MNFRNLSALAHPLSRGWKMNSHYWTKKRFNTLARKWNDRTLRVWIRHLSTNPDCPVRVLTWLKNEESRRLAA
jgi:hypothetical protein